MISRYLILLLINLPLVTVLLIRFTVDYKTKQITKKKYVGLVLLLIVVVISLSVVEPLYSWLLNHDLTSSGPMTLFDMILLTVIVFISFGLIRSNQRATEMRKEIARIHEHIAFKEVK